MSAMNWPVLGQMTGGSSGEHHVDLKSIDNSEAEDAVRTAETMCQLGLQQISQEVEGSQELLIYPEGEVDAVAITARDVEGLEPGRFLSNNIVDFYIRFLERGLSPERRNRFYFFNSFFFTKLLQSSASTGTDSCKVDYEQLRKWTEEVNLFAKDYVFIPILKSSHWSLVIICHLSNLTCPPGEMTRSPCVVHLDPFEGQHKGFEDLIRSYVLQAWMEKFQSSSDRDQLRALCQMKYVKGKVPQQNNSHDCGLHVLHYIEAFLVKSTSSDFSFPSSGMVPHFIDPHFVREVLGKRNYIQNLIHELSGISQKRSSMRRAIQEVRQSTLKLRFLLFHEGNFEACTKDVQTVHPTFFTGQGIEINHSSTHEDALISQERQSTLISRVDTEPLDGPEIGPTMYEDRSECFSPKQQYVEPNVQSRGPTHFNGSISVAKHVSTHVDAIDVHHQQSSGLSTLDGPELQHVEYWRVNEDMLQQVPCTDLFEVQKGKNKRGRKMTREETWVLLSCMLEGGRFRKGSGGHTHWNLICEEIGKKLGSSLSADQCRLRYDTLLKAYKTCKKYCMETGKTFSAITGAERVDLKLATTLSEEMYTTIDEIDTKANTSQKRMKLSSPASLAPNPPPLAKGRSFEEEALSLGSLLIHTVVLERVTGVTVEVALRHVIPASMFSSFNEDLQWTLLNLVQECSWGCEVKNGRVFDLGAICRRLAIVQDREPREILHYVFQLWKLDFVNVVGMVFEEGGDLAHINLWDDKTWCLKFEFYEKISKEVFCKNPEFQTYWDSYPIEQSLIQYIRVLTLSDCYQLEHLDLRGFSSLRSLVIWDCPELNLITGWEFATGLAELRIQNGGVYCDFPEVRYLFSLREIDIRHRKSNKSAIPWQLSQFSQCSKLRRLKIWDDESLSKIADLENLKELKFLEFLSLGRCSFSSIQGLSGLQALTTLKLIDCPGLRRVPGLGCLTRLTHLNIHNSSVEDVEGVGELHLLTSLRLVDCPSLKWLPFLGHLKALVHLNIWGTSVKEVPGREDLINLKIII